MRQFSTDTRFLSVIAAVLLAVSFQACTRWSLVRDPQSLAATPRRTVRLTTDGTPRHLIVKNPTISGDSIVWSVPARGGIPLSEVEWVEARAPDRMATGFFVFVGVAFLGLVALLQ